MNKHMLEDYGLTGHEVQLTATSPSISGDAEGVTSPISSGSRLRDAVPLSMLHIPNSLQAEALVSAVVAMVGAGEERGRARGPKGTTKLIAAVAAIVGGVLVEALRRNRLVFRSLSKPSFAGERVGYLQAKESLNKLAFFCTLVEFSGDRLEIFFDAAVELCERWV